jgi:hypothetical protein
VQSSSTSQSGNSLLLDVSNSTIYIPQHDINLTHCIQVNTQATEQMPPKAVDAELQSDVVFDQALPTVTLSLGKGPPAHHYRPAKNTGCMPARSQSQMKNVAFNAK